MATSALVISIISALTALAALWSTSAWRRQSHRAAVSAFRMLVKRKQVFVADVSDWWVNGIHTSVYELRDQLVNAMSTLPWQSMSTAEDMVDDCTRFLTSLRPWLDVEQAPEDVLALHRTWVTRMSAHLATLDRQAKPRLHSRKPTRAEAS
ncbi:hypothetical protein Amsp01_017770 [Amycolatopsis sp. NBRC 101858]|uniref:hypothetical protein n=1 Tax=Amycolatopsis sp. NBRC 101858 TaxID=3032200 RepID=UPI0024A2B7C7|nr:hypothetical protein [Amycolatopsis sp. NBRC 101858]GLY35753.1 hypothetical protein Amsp01_017770 [Amycolatopsis sp. NBRC 101858]